ncbi:hypothetical protein CGJ12_01215, partial [Vibrio parahaemolyticus]
MVLLYSKAILLFMSFSITGLLEPPPVLPSPSHDRKSKNDQCVKHSGTNDFIRRVIIPAHSNIQLCDEKVLYELQVSEILKL